MLEGIVVVGHGSPAAGGENNRVYFQIADLISQKAEYYLVEPAILIRQNGFPSIEDAVRKLVDRGARKITVVPAFLTNGVHIIKDIPAEINRLSGQLPGVTLVLAGCIGDDPRVADILLDRVKEVSRA